MHVEFLKIGYNDGDGKRYGEYACNFGERMIMVSLKDSTATTRTDMNITGQNVSKRQTNIQRDGHTDKPYKRGA